MITKKFDAYKAALAQAVFFALFIISSGPARAHSFSLVFVAPLSGENMGQGKQALDGFMLATGEEDSHALEESDGHLGGLDSYVYTLDSSLESKTMLEKLDSLITTKQPVFVTGVFNANLEELLKEATREKNVAFFSPDNSGMWQTNKDSLGKLVNINGRSLSVTMQEISGYTPGPNAYRGYIAARLISTAVRSLAEDPDDNISLTTEALMRAQKML
jgi:hypothetical protein